MSARRISWRTKPPLSHARINHDHPLAQGLTAFLIPYGRGIIDLISGKLLSLDSGAFSNVTPVYGRVDTGEYQGLELGQGLELEAGVDVSYLLPITENGGSQITMAIGAAMRNGTSTASPFILAAQNAAVNRYISLRLRQNAGANRRHVVWSIDLVGGGNTCSVDQVDNATEFHNQNGIAVCTENSDLDRQMILNPSGIVTSETDAGTNNNDALTELRVSNGGSAGTIWFFFGAWWNGRELSETEARQIQANPWQIFEPRRVWLPGADAGGSDNLLADDIESTSEVSTPAVGQEHALLADAVESTSEVTIPAISQEHALLAADIQSTSEVSAPILAEVGGGVDNLLAEDVQSMSEVSAPALGQEYALLAEDVQSMSEVSAPAISQTHTLLASDTESLSFVSNPTLDRQASGQPLTWANADTAFSGASAVNERPFIDSFI